MPVLNGIAGAGWPPGYVLNRDGQPAGWLESRALGSGAPAETLTFPAPTSADTDNGPPVTLAVAFTVTVAGSFIGVRIRNPDTNTVSGPTAVGGNSTLGTLLQQQPFVPLTGAFQDVDFPAPIPVSPGTTYFAGFWANRFAFTATAFPLSSASGRILAANGLFTAGAAPAVPTTSFTSFYQVSPRITF